MAQPIPYIGVDEAFRNDEEARIVFDRFHIMREMTKAVDSVRKQEHRGFLRAGDDSPLTAPSIWACSALERPDHERCSRGAEQQDHEHQAQGRRLPEPRSLHNRDLLPLRGIGPLPTLIPEEAYFLRSIQAAR